MKKALFLVVPLLWGAAVAQAASPFTGIQQGEKEIGGAFSYMKPTESGSSSSWMAMGNIGYFLTPNVQVKGLGLVFGGGGNKNGTVGLTGDYLFDLGYAVMPYAGGGLLFSVGDTDLGTLVDVHAGVKQFLSERTSLNYEGKYMLSLSDTSSGMLLFTVGLSIYLQ